jgi:NAD(P)-dependent dehydrogenase (short-subunit alcohol dehydrogenase family)
MSRLVEGKVVIVTGGGSGIGRASVEDFVKEGARVVVVDINAEAGSLVTETLRVQYSADVATFVHADVTRKDDVSRIVSVALEKFGKIDVLFNNAGIQPASSNKPLHELDEEMWDLVLNVNLKSVFLLSRVVIPVMLRNPDGGVIINNSSGTAVFFVPNLEIRSVLLIRGAVSVSVQGTQSQKAVPAYAASKGALNSLTRNMVIRAIFSRFLFPSPPLTGSPRPSTTRLTFVYWLYVLARPTPLCIEQAIQMVCDLLVFLRHIH